MKKIPFCRGGYGVAHTLLSLRDISPGRGITLAARYFSIKIYGNGVGRGRAMKSSFAALPQHRSPKAGFICTKGTTSFYVRRLVNDVCVLHKTMLCPADINTPLWGGSPLRCDHIFCWKTFGVYHTAILLGSSGRRPLRI